MYQAVCTKYIVYLAQYVQHTGLPVPNIYLVSTGNTPSTYLLHMWYLYNMYQVVHTEYMLCSTLYKPGSIYR